MWFSLSKNVSWFYPGRPSFYYKGWTLRDGRFSVQRRPVALRKDMLKRVHIGHMGVVKCKNRTKRSCFGPVWTIRYKTLSQIAQPAQSTRCLTPMIVHELPQRPWQNVATDLFMLENEHYLIVVDFTTADILSWKECLPQLDHYQQAESHFWKTWHSGEISIW